MALGDAHRKTEQLREAESWYGRAEQLYPLASYKARATGH